MLTRYTAGSRVLSCIIIAEAGIWLLVAVASLLGGSLHPDSWVAGWLTLPSAFTAFLERPWTLLTYMWVHFDVLHMLFNVLWLYWFGRLLLIDASDRTLALYFFGGGVSGGLLFLASSAAGLGGGWLCGCSAAVIAVMCGAAFRHPDLELNLLLIGRVRLKWVALACCLLTFLGGGGNQAAHIGGLLWGVGLALIWPWLRSRRPQGGERRRRPDRMIRALNDHRTDMQRLDALLDKIRLSGYGSLSRRERKELDELSRRIRK